MYKVERDNMGFARAVSEDGRYIIHLEAGTVFNEKNIDGVVALINSSSAKDAQIERLKELLSKAYGYVSSDAACSGSDLVYQIRQALKDKESEK